MHHWDVEVEQLSQSPPVEVALNQWTTDKNLRARGAEVVIANDESVTIPQVQRGDLTWWERSADALATTPMPASAPLGLFHPQPLVDFVAPSKTEAMHRMALNQLEAY